MHRSRTHLLGLTAAALMSLAGLAQGQTATWIGGSSTNWSDPANWSPPVVPLGPSFDVIIPAGVSIVIDAGVPASFSLNSLNLNATATLTVSPSRNVTLTEGTISGRIVAQSNAVFDATAPGVEFTGGPRFAVTGGGVIRAGATTYSTAAYNETIFSSSDAGSLLDLSSLESFVRQGQGYIGYTATILASNQGAIDLSGLQTIESRGDDTARFRAESGGTIDLGSLQTTGGSGRVRFESAGAGSLLDFDSLTTADNTDLTATSGGTINAMGLTSLTNGSITLNGTGTLNLGTLGNIDGTRFIISGGESFGTGVVTDTTYSTAAYNETIFSSSDAGSLLDLSSLESFVRQGQGYIGYTATILASNQGAIDLSGLQTIESRGDDTARFRAESGGTIDLGSLQTTGGSGQTRFEVATQGEMNFGSFTLGTNGRLTALDSSATVSVSDQFTIAGGTLDLASGSVMNLGGNFQINTTNEASMLASSSIMHFTGSGTFSSPQWLEAAGSDLGAMDPGSNGNFGFGQLILGTETQSTVLQLVDLFDNGNRIGGAIDTESLYLFGLSGSDGLIINDLSTLVIGDINVYTTVGGEWLWINSLFTGGATSIEWGGGFIVIPSPGSLPLLIAAGIFANRRRRSSSQSI